MCHTTWRASFLPYSYTITKPCSHSSLILQAVSWRTLVEKNVTQLEECVDAEISWQKMAEMNVAETQVDVVASAWKNAEAGYDELSGVLSAACKNATELLVVREAQEANDAAIAASLQAEV